MTTEEMIALRLAGATLREIAALAKMSVSGVVGRIGRAASMPGPTRKLKARACMTCGRTFASAGAHNRMCDLCRKKAGDISPYDLDFPWT